MLKNSCSTRGISHNDDALPALAGVAEEVTQCTRYNYKAGLWLEDIHRRFIMATNKFFERN